MRDIGTPTVNIYGIRLHVEKVNLSPPSSSGHLKIILQNFSNFYLLKLQNCLLFDVHGWFNKAEGFFLSRCRSNWKLMCHLSSPQPDENFLNTIPFVCVSAAYQTFRQNRHIRPIVKLTFPCHLELDRSQIEIPSLVENTQITGYKIVAAIRKP